MVNISWKGLTEEERAEYVQEAARLQTIPLCEQEKDMMVRRIVQEIRAKVCCCSNTSILAVNMLCLYAACRCTCICLYTLLIMDVSHCISFRVHAYNRSCSRWWFTITLLVPNNTIFMNSDMSSLGSQCILYAGHVQQEILILLCCEICLNSQDNSKFESWVSGMTLIRLVKSFHHILYSLIYLVKGLWCLQVWPSIPPKVIYLQGSHKDIIQAQYNI